MENEALYPFGFGLSYSDIELVSANTESKDHKAASEEGIKITCEVKNNSSSDGDEILQVYVKNDDANETLHPHLAAFERISVPAGKSISVDITVPASAFTTVDEEGIRAVRGSSSEIFVGFGQPDKRTEVLTGKISKTIRV